MITHELDLPIKMESQSDTASQLRAARLAGLLYLIAMGTGLFAEFYVHFPSALIAIGDAAKTASNITAYERLYRIGIANNIITFAIDLVLIWALYVLLRPVNRNLALLAVFFRLVETTVACFAIIISFVAMQFVSEPPQKAFDSEQLQALSIMHSTYASTFVVVAIFLGLGSAIFNYLFLKSGYIPKILAAWGVFSSLVLLMSQFAIIVYPGLEQKIIPACFGPIIIDEIALGIWLLFKGVHITGSTS
jgi:magnesium-transporting ATPase (P-type)